MIIVEKFRRLSSDFPQGNILFYIGLYSNGSYWSKISQWSELWTLMTQISETVADVIDSQKTYTGTEVESQEVLHREV